MKTINIFARCALILSGALFAVSCQKEISVDLNDSASQVVIEGNITDQSGPYYVKISQSVNFSESNDMPKVSGAIVIISDDIGNIDTLKELEAGLYSTKIIKGLQGITYFLNVNVNNKQYYASCKMPDVVKIDSLEAIKNTIFGNSNDEANYNIKVNFNDPAGKKNYYRFIKFINGVRDSSFTVINDNLIDGMKSSETLRSREVKIHLKDSVAIEMQCIDSSVYTYFYVLNKNMQNGAGGGSAPTNPPSNISGGALGYFSAHTTQTKSIIVK